MPKEPDQPPGETSNQNEPPDALVTFDDAKVTPISFLIRVKERVHDLTPDIVKDALANIQSGISAGKKKVQGATPNIVKDNFSRVTSGFTLAANVLTAISGAAQSTPFRTAAAAFDSVILMLGITNKPLSQTEEEIDQLKEMAPHRYIGERLKQSVFPQRHIRQTLGVGFIITGAGYLAAGVSSGRTTEVAIGCQVITAGGALTFTLEDDKAWTRFGAIVATMQPMGIAHAVEAVKEGNDWWIPAAQTMHMGTAVTSWLYGDAEKSESAQESDKPKEPLSKEPYANNITARGDKDDQSTQRR